MSDSETSLPPALPRNEYTIGWVCALSTELTAATAMLDSEHELPNNPPGDKNVYTVGSIGKHNIVIACLPKGKQGTTSAAVVATQMLESFPSIKFGLMIGVGGGIPTKDHDIRLGDVVVSTPTSMFPGVVQLDLGKATEGGGFERVGSLNNPPNNLLAALQRLETRHEMKGSKIKKYVDGMINKWKNLEQKYSRLDSMEDVLFASDEVTRIIERKPRDGVKVHYGLIASGNKVIKDAVLRDKINSDLNDDVLCVEMEAAGLMDNFPCLVIRGICDYADSHKNDDWQGYAAAMAAAFAKELLSIIPASEVEQMENIKIIADRIGEIFEDVRKIHQDQKRHARDEILEWLTPVNYDAQHHEHLSKKSPGSGKWFLEHPSFQQFLNGDKNTLLCQGNPGAGKTILTSAVIEHLQNEQYYHNVLGIDKVNLAFIYFDFIRKESQRTIDVFASLVKQLLRDKSTLPTAVEDLREKYKTIPASSRSKMDIKEFSKALKHLMSDKQKKTFIVIDALDECQDRDDFLENILTVIKDADAKLFATTRQSESVEERFKSGLFLEISASIEDVGHYIEGRLSEFTVLNDENCDIPKESRISLKREIIAKVSNAIDGIFLLAKFHIDSLLVKTTLRQIRKMLRELPRGSDAYKQAYEKTIIRIRGQPSEHQQLARRTLGWLACAAREITALEFRYALSIRGDCNSVSSEEDLESTNFVIKVCMGLVLVERESGIIRLLHHTALEYLQENLTCLWHLENSETVETYFQPPKSSMCAMREMHQDIAKTCIKYLSFKDILSSSIVSFSGKNKISDDYPFLKYAVQHWAHHWREGFNETTLPLSIIQITTVFLESDTMTDNFDLWKSKRRLWPKDMTLIHFAAFFGLTSMIDFCLINGHDINTTTRYGENALWFALMGKHEGTSKALLQRGAKEVLIRCLVRESLSSLGLAIDNGMRVAADLLLDENFGAKINPETDVDTGDNRPLDWRRSFFFKPPLILAVEKGNLEMTKMLLKRGADLLAKYENSGFVSVGNEALITATYSGYKDIVESLLQADSRFVNEVDNRHKTPLYWAFYKGNWSTASVLLRHGGTLFRSSTYLDPGLPKNVSLINGQPSSIRFWGRDGMPVDFDYDSYEMFKESDYIQKLLKFYNESPTTVFVPCSSAKILNKAFAWSRHITKVKMNTLNSTLIDEVEREVVREIEREHLLEDITQLADYLGLTSLEYAISFHEIHNGGHHSSTLENEVKLEVTQEIEGENLWEDMEEFAKYLSRRPPEFTMNFHINIRSYKPFMLL